MTTETENKTVKTSITTPAQTTTQANIIPEAQKDLGVPEDRHFTKKEPLLKITLGSLVSNLAIAEYYDEKTGSYQPPRPAYSFYFTERVKSADGSVTNRTTNIPIPKDSESLRSLGEHLIKVAKAIDGLELSRSNDVDDFDAALKKLESFKKA